jgi:hypothetical protein
MVLDLRCTLAQVGPFIGFICEAMFVGAFRTPHNSRRGAGGVEAGMRSVAFMSVTELSVNLRVGFYGSR